jgi:hypothetical protein
LRRSEYFFIDHLIYCRILKYREKIETRIHGKQLCWHAVENCNNFFIVVSRFVIFLVTKWLFTLIFLQVPSFEEGSMLHSANISCFHVNIFIWCQKKCVPYELQDCSYVRQGAAHLFRVAVLITAVLQRALISSTNMAPSAVDSSRSFVYSDVYSSPVSSSMFSPISSLFCVCILSICDTWWVNIEEISCLLPY